MPFPLDVGTFQGSLFALGFVFLDPSEVLDFDAVLFVQQVLVIVVFVLLDLVAQHGANLHAVNTAGQLDGDVLFALPFLDVGRVEGECRERLVFRGLLLDEGLDQETDFRLDGLGGTLVVGQRNGKHLVGPQVVDLRIVAIADVGALVVVVDAVTDHRDDGFHAEGVVAGILGVLIDTGVAAFLVVLHKTTGVVVTFVVARIVHSLGDAVKCNLIVPFKLGVGLVLNFDGVLAACAKIERNGRG